MAFKNAFKILYARFSLVWSLAIFLLILLIVAGSVSLIFILPAARAFSDAGLFEQMRGVLSTAFAYRDITLFGTASQYIWTQMLDIFRYDRNLGALATVMFFIVTAAFRFLLGFYEIPVYRVLEGSMSANAKFSFTGRVIASAGISARFVLAKLLVTAVYDAGFLIALYFMLGLFLNSATALWAPFIIFVFLVAFLALRYTLLAFFGAHIAVDKPKVFKGLAFGFKKSAKYFGKTYAQFLLLWLIIIVFNVFFAAFTFGVALIATIPMSMVLLCIFNMTLYYTKTGRRFYADDKIVTPPDSGLHEKQAGETHI